MIALSVVITGAFGAGVSVAADPIGQVTEVPTGIGGGCAGYDMAFDADGNLWVPDAGCFSDSVRKVTSAGTVTRYALPIANLGPCAVAAGPDGSVWLVDWGADRIWKVTAAGVVTPYDVVVPPHGNGTCPGGIAVGPDGNMWFTEYLANRVGKITPAGVVTEYATGITAGSRPFDIAAGPDGNMWFTEVEGNSVGKITPAGVVTEYATGITAGSRPYGIAAGPDGNMWFTEFLGQRIGRITPAGVVTEYTLPFDEFDGELLPLYPSVITAGPDGNMWFWANGAAEGLWRIGVAVTDPDADADGVDDRIDVGDGAFDDEDGTTGAITDAAGNDVFVAPDPDGVRITVTGSGSDKSVFTVCGFTLRLLPGSEVVASCGSITTSVITGQAELVLAGGLTLVSIPAGVTARVDEQPDGSFLVEHLAGGLPVGVTVDGVPGTVAPGTSLKLEAWDFIGFGSPVDAAPTLNVVKAGQAVPLKWRVLDAGGSPVTDLTAATVRVSGLSCAAGASSDQLEELAAGGSGLQNLGGGYYQLNWKTPKSYANSCKTLSLDIGDGVTHIALFRLAK